MSGIMTDSASSLLVEDGPLSLVKTNEDVLKLQYRRNGYCSTISHTMPVLKRLPFPSSDGLVEDASQSSRWSKKSNDGDRTEVDQDDLLAILIKDILMIWQSKGKSSGTIITENIPGAVSVDWLHPLPTNKDNTTLVVAHPTKLDLWQKNTNLVHISSISLSIDADSMSAAIRKAHLTGEHTDWTAAASGTLLLSEDGISIMSVESVASGVLLLLLASPASEAAIAVGLLRLPDSEDPSSNVEVKVACMTLSDTEIFSRDSASYSSIQRLEKCESLLYSQACSKSVESSGVPKGYLSTTFLQAMVVPNASPTHLKVNNNSTEKEMQNILKRLDGMVNHMYQNIPQLSKKMLKTTNGQELQVKAFQTNIYDLITETHKVRNLIGKLQEEFYESNFEEDSTQTKPLTKLISALSHTQDVHHAIYELRNSDMVAEFEDDQSEGENNNEEQYVHTIGHATLFAGAKVIKASFSSSNKYTAVFYKSEAAKTGLDIFHLSDEVPTLKHDNKKQASIHRGGCALYTPSRALVQIGLSRELNHKRESIRNSLKILKNPLDDALAKTSDIVVGAQLQLTACQNSSRDNALDGIRDVVSDVHESEKFIKAKLQDMLKKLDAKKVEYNLLNDTIDIYSEHHEEKECLEDLFKKIGIKDQPLNGIAAKSPKHLKLISNYHAECIPATRTHHWFMANSIQEKDDRHHQRKIFHDTLRLFSQKACENTISTFYLPDSATAKTAASDAQQHGPFVATKPIEVVPVSDADFITTCTPLPEPKVVPVSEAQSVTANGLVQLMDKIKREADVPASDTMKKSTTKLNLSDKSNTETKTSDTNLFVSNTTVNAATFDPQSAPAAVSSTKDTTSIDFSQLTPKPKSKSSILSADVSSGTSMGADEVWDFKQRLTDYYGTHDVEKLQLIPKLVKKYPTLDGQSDVMERLYTKAAQEKNIQMPDIVLKFMTNFKKLRIRQAHIDSCRRGSSGQPGMVYIGPNVNHQLLQSIIETYRGMKDTSKGGHLIATEVPVLMEKAINGTVKNDADIAKELERIKKFVQDSSPDISGGSPAFPSANNKQKANIPINTQLPAVPFGSKIAGSPVSGSVSPQTSFFQQPSKTPVNLFGGNTSPFADKTGNVSPQRSPVVGSSSGVPLSPSRFAAASGIPSSGLPSGSHIGSGTASPSSLFGNKTTLGTASPPSTLFGGGSNYQSGGSSATGAALDISKVSSSFGQPTNSGGLFSGGMGFAQQPQSSQLGQNISHRDEIIKEITHIYTTYAPDKLMALPNLLQKNIGKEDELLMRIKKKYNLTGSMIAQPQSALGSMNMNSGQPPQQQQAGGLFGGGGGMQQGASTFGNQSSQQQQPGGLFGGGGGMQQGASTFGNQSPQQQQPGGLFGRGGGMQQGASTFGNQSSQQQQAGGLFG